MSRCAQALAAAICIVVTLGVHAQQRSGTLPPTTVKDLYYGDVLFHYFQDDYFGALTRLRLAQEKNRVPHHAEEAELLLGGLYLSYGQHLEAGKIFDRLLAGRASPAVRDRAWFFVGKMWYQRGYWQQAERALREVGRPAANAGVDRVMAPALAAELQNLLAQVLIYQGRYDEAIAQLSESKGPADWKVYGQFNLGVALVRAGRFAEGARLLDAVGRINTVDEELLALRDKANVALGYAYLQAEQPALATPALQRVRLQGSQSNKALLAFGWAESAQNRHSQALVPWMELRQRDLMDAAVQESYLAIPYAFAQLNAHAQAVEYYTAAAKSYEEESAKIDSSIEAIRGGRLVEAILDSSETQREGWFWKLENVPQAPESRYLYQLLARHEFQEGIKNYRDLRFMQRNLAQWAGNVEVFGDMLDTRRLGYRQKLPNVEALLAGKNPDQLAQQRVDLESRLNAVEGSEDIVALATRQERQMWARIARLEEDLGLDSAATAKERDKLRLLKGVLYWQMNEGFKARLWNARRSMKELDRSLTEMQRRWLRVQAAKGEFPASNTEFSGRIAALESRMAGLEQRIAGVNRVQGDYLATIAIRELQAQKERLAEYRLQARYALAAIYDQASAAETEE